MFHLTVFLSNKYVSNDCLFNYFMQKLLLNHQKKQLNHQRKLHQNNALLGIVSLDHSPWYSFRLIFLLISDIVQIFFHWSLFQFVPITDTILFFDYPINFVLPFFFRRNNESIFDELQSQDTDIIGDVDFGITGNTKIFVSLWILKF